MFITVSSVIKKKDYRLEQLISTACVEIIKYHQLSTKKCLVIVVVQSLVVVFIDQLSDNVSSIKKAP